jgi:1,4-alpha-glucan branching enzyme
MRTPKSARNNMTTGTATMAPRVTEPKPAGVASVQSYGPRQVGNSVTFIASFPQAKTVQIAGDFNGWKPEKNPMSKALDGTWQARVSLEKGTYRYRLVVDGKWQHDPWNSSTEPNPYGELNSVLKVT